MSQKRNKGKPEGIKIDEVSVMGGAGLEPATPRTSSVCSTGLS